MYTLFSKQYLIKAGANSSDLRTTAGADIVDTVRLIYGSSVAKETLRVTDTNPTLHYSLQGLISNANYSMKKMTLILFINSEFPFLPLIFSSSSPNSLIYDLSCSVW
jgi:hypothetical protein